VNENRSDVNLNKDPEIKFDQIDVVSILWF